MQIPKRGLIFVPLVAAMLIAPLYLRTLWEARLHLDRAEKLVAQDRFSPAFTEYRRALAWSSPFNQPAAMGNERLRAFAFDSTLSPELRLEALENLLSGLQSSRNVFHPRTAELADEEIGPILREISKLTENTSPSDELRPLERPEINFAGQLLAQAFFLCWVSAALWSIRRGFSARGNPEPKQLWSGLAATTIFYVLWLAALAL